MPKYLLGSAPSETQVIVLQRCILFLALFARFSIIAVAKYTVQPLSGARLAVMSCCKAKNSDAVAGKQALLVLRSYQHYRCRKATD